jgi:hypothetical protein
MCTKYCVGCKSYGDKKIIVFFPSYSQASRNKNEEEQKDFTEMQFPWKQ